MFWHQFISLLIILFDRPSFNSVHTWMAGLFNVIHLRCFCGMRVPTIETGMATAFSYYMLSCMVTKDIYIVYSQVVYHDIYKCLYFD